LGDENLKTHCTRIEEELLEGCGFKVLNDVARVIVLFLTENTN
jgi:hypothetical protein